MKGGVTVDRHFMAIALEQARRGLGRTSPNPAVGAVLVRRGRVIGTGYHRRAGLPHAEVEAIRAARRGGRSTRGATLYVTLEPCLHFGRTPPCTEAILEAGIREVVVGMRDPDPKVRGRGMRGLRARGVRVREGVLRRECEEMLSPYTKHRKTGLPWVILKIASTLDGVVAVPRGRRRWVTGPIARRHAHGVRNQVDAILVGRGTVLKDDPRLTTRLPGGRDPVRVVLDSRLKLPLSLRLFHLRSKAPTIVATLVSPHSRRAVRFQRRGVSLLYCRRGEGGRVDLRDLLRRLGRMGIVSLLVEGGPTVWGSFLRQRLADRLLLYLAPGPLAGLRSFPLGEDLLVEASLSQRVKNGPVLFPLAINFNK